MCNNLTKLTKIAVFTKEIQIKNHGAITVRYNSLNYLLLISAILVPYYMLVLLCVLTETFCNLKGRYTILGLVVGAVVAESLMKCLFFLLEDELPKGPTIYL